MATAGWQFLAADMEPTSDIPKVQRKITSGDAEVTQCVLGWDGGELWAWCSGKDTLFSPPKSYCRVRAQAEARREVSQISLMENWTRSRQQPVHLKLTERYFFYL